MYIWNKNYKIKLFSIEVFIMNKSKLYNNFFLNNIGEMLLVWDSILCRVYGKKSHPSLNLLKIKNIELYLLNFTEENSSHNFPSVWNQSHICISKITTKKYVAPIQNSEKKKVSAVIHPMKQNTHQIAGPSNSDQTAENAVLTVLILCIRSVVFRSNGRDWITDPYCWRHEL